MTDNPEQREHRQASGLGDSREQSPNGAAGTGNGSRRPAGAAGNRETIRNAANYAVDKVSPTTNGFLKSKAQSAWTNTAKEQEILSRLAMNYGYSQEEVEALRNKIYDTAAQDGIRVAPSELLAGVEAMMAKSGNKKFTEENVENLGMLIQAEGISGKAAGESMGGLGSIGKNSDQTMDIMDILRSQAKAGGSSLQEAVAFNAQMYGAYEKMGRGGPEATRELGAVFQVLRKGTGDSKTASKTLDTFFYTLNDSDKLEKLNGLEIDGKKLDLFEPGKTADGKQVLKPIHELMPELIKAAGKDSDKLKDIFGAPFVKALGMTGMSQKDHGKEAMAKIHGVKAEGGIEKDSARMAEGFNASKAVIQGAWERLSGDMLSGTMNISADALQALGPQGSKYMFSGLTLAGGGLMAASGLKKGFGLYNDIKNIFRGNTAGGGDGASTGGGGSQGVQDVRVVNWPESEVLDGSDNKKRRRRKKKKRNTTQRRKQKPRRQARGGSNRRSSGIMSRLTQSKSWGGAWAKGARLLGKVGRIGGPIAAIAGIADVGMAYMSGDQKRIGSALGRSGGGLAGAAAGAAIGSVVPVIGTAIGGLAGGILGSLFGEKVGKAAGTILENKPAPQAAMVGAGAMAGPISINIHPTPSQSPRAIAEEVIRVIEKKRSRRLHD
ncbi:MAG: hypothetical protein V6Z89_18710 [Desulfobacter sp.]